MMKRLLVLLLCMSGTVPVPAQLPYFRELVINRQEDEIRTGVFFQSRQGLLYIGTNKGLYRYDGFAFTGLLEERSSFHRHITAIIAFGQDGFITGADNGELLIWEGDKPRRMSAPFHSPVRSLFFDENNVLWVATYGEGLFYRIGSIWHRLAGLPDPFIYTLEKHPSGLLLAGTDGGLVVINKETNPVRFFVYQARHGLPDNIVRAIGILPDNRLLLGLQEKGITIFDLTTKQFTAIEKMKEWTFGAVSVMVRLQNEFWLGTEGQGIVDFEFRGDRRMRHFATGVDFPCARIHAMFRDAEGNIWIAGDNKLLISPGETVEFLSSVNQLPVDSVQAITSCPDGFLWFGNPQGVFRLDYLAKETNRLKQYTIDPRIPELHIVTLYRDKNELLWIGTFDNGLYCLNVVTGKVIRYNERNGLPNANVMSISGTDSSIWLATLGGVVEMRPRDNFSDVYEVQQRGEAGASPAIYNDFVYTLYTDKRGNLWMGTDGQGLLRYDGKVLHRYDGQMPAKVVYSICEDLSGNIWFSTQRNGIYCYNGSTFRNLNLSGSLSEIDISGLSMDNAGNMLAVNKKGIDLIHPLTFEVQQIGEESGLRGFSSDLNAITRDRKGSVWIGTHAGIVRFYNYSRQSAVQPRLVIRRVLTFMKQDVGLKDTVFDYNQNTISIEYAGLWYTKPEQVTYRYRMKGYSNDWIPTRDRIVTFPNLPPGKYTFEVMAGLGGQFRHASLAAYSFEIRKVLWKETWFIVLVMVLLAGLIILYIRDRDSRFRRMESLKKEKVEYQYATLKSQVNPHFLFNSFNTLMAIIESDPQKAADYVEKLSDYFRNMVQHRDRDIITLEEELEMVETYYFLQQKRFGADLRLTLRIPEQWKKQYGVPPLSLQLLLENAVKHNVVSYESPLEITVTATDHASLLIQNNLNLKVKTDASTGIGIENIVNRFNILASKEVIVSSGDHIFTVEIPLIPMP